MNIVRAKDVKRLTFKQLLPPMQTQSNLIGLVLGARGGGMSGQVAGGGDEDVSGFGLALEQSVLADGGFDGLDGVKILVFA